MNFIENETAQKLRGGYYTPFELSMFVSKWIMATKPKEVLEPSCGDGIFAEAIERLSAEAGVHLSGFEINREEAKAAKARSRNFSKTSVTIEAADFLEWAIQRIVLDDKRFDGVVGNPPFIRYQYLTKAMQDESQSIFNLLGIKMTKHTNAWVPFVLSTLHLLKPGGRFGMIVPSEILHIIHAHPLRQYIARECKRILIFDPKDLWFDGTLQGAMILLAEKKTDSDEKNEGLAIVETNGLAFAGENPDDYFHSVTFRNGETLQGKWTYALLSSEEFHLYTSLKNESRVKKFKQIADVDVGIVTGANRFFLVDDRTVDKYSLHQYAHPMFGRSEHCPGIIYDEKQHFENSIKGLPTNFIWLNVQSINDLSDPQREYVKHGEEQKLQNRYKCRIRTPWFRVPSVYSTAVGMLKRSHDFPRLIFNKIGAFTTDTAYRIRTNIDPQLLVSSFVNSLTALGAELEGRHYGGGVLELVPSEIEKLLVPISAHEPDLESLNKLIRSSSSEKIMTVQDNKVLEKFLLRSDIELLRLAWLKLKRRRQRHASINEII